MKKEDTGEFIPGRWRSEVTQMWTIAKPVYGFKSSKLAREFLDYIKRHHVNNEGALPWQESRIYLAFQKCKILHV